MLAIFIFIFRVILNYLISSVFVIKYLVITPIVLLIIDHFDKMNIGIITELLPIAIKLTIN